ncbi:MAG: hypothetical protein K2Y37_20515 [Pirellulales bacterium]|nr:hypothetical protein [Pirellulales bacterium]
MTRFATAFRRSDGYYYIHADSQTTEGVGVGVRPFLKLSIGVPAVRLGEAVCEALAASRMGIPHPTNWDSVEFPLPTMAGVKSWARFADGAQCVSIEDDNGTLTIVPHKKKGPKGGFEELKSAITVRGDLTPAAIGEAVAKAFELCE